ncbi:hypothetical protein B9Z55_007619 [Caenorhabditis nigoni]|uniref:BTB domain-containing protein n=1 Tax=Caenorhabditis nigoni TaxID=1611254 RepID=A0A2G5VAK6_9PELO|nr:hypothetical protein B9Z55_007619 [Caenorhabditis nigoni]
MTEREFTLKHILTDVEKFEQNDILYSPEKDYFVFGVGWKIRIEKNNERLGMYLYANVTGNQEVHADRTMKIFSKNKEKIHSKSGSSVFENRGDPPRVSWGWPAFIDWKTLEDEYLDDGKLKVEIHLKITQMAGFPEEIAGFSRKELRSFGEDMKQFSDVTLKVKEQKFYVSKLYLSSQSTYFGTLFLGRFQESEKSEIELKDVDPQYFQYYLEVIYAENSIDGSMTEKEFTLQYMIHDVGKLGEDESLYSLELEHFGVKWKIRIQKKNEHLGMYLFTNVTGNEEIHADRTLKILSKNKEKTHSMNGSRVFEKSNIGFGRSKFIDWKTLENEYLDDGKLEVDVHVKINKMVGFLEEIAGFSRKELRSFGEDMKQFSDVTLKVKERKFYVSKLYLSSHSPYFATLFLGKFEESEKSEIELKNVDPQDFQYYLEVLHLENGIDVADMFDTPKIVEKCEDFLVKESKMGLKKKLELAGSYRLEKLKHYWLFSNGSTTTYGELHMTQFWKSADRSSMGVTINCTSTQSGWPKKYNRFFRLWMTGSAPGLEHLHVITADHEINKDALLRKLVHTQQCESPRSPKKLETNELDIFVSGTINWAQRVKSKCRDNSIPLKELYKDNKFHMLREIGCEFLEEVWNEIDEQMSELEEMRELDGGDTESRSKKFLFEIQQTSKDGVCEIWENLSPANLFNQILYIYRRSEFDFVDIQDNSHLIDIRSVAKAVSKVGQLSVMPSSSKMHNQLILNVFPHVECLKIVKTLLLNGDDYKSAFIQYITRIEVGKTGRTPVPFNLTLDHLLVSNCLSVKVIDGNFSEEKYNQFFRMWMNGSAPRMEHLHFATVNLEIDEKALMKELDCHGATMDVYRKQPNRPGYLHDQLVTRPTDGGVCIVRRDGIKAVVTVENNKLEFFVFHPKCYHNDFDWIF